jgi:hypothetical protein
MKTTTRISETQFVLTIISDSNQTIAPTYKSENLISFNSTILNSVYHSRRSFALLLPGF